MMKTKTKAQKTTNEKDLNYYLNLAYTIKLYPDSEGGYVAQIEDLPGCLTQGDTLEEAVDNINEARELWIETAYEAGDPIPLPLSQNNYSGKILVRMPKSLHRDLIQKATTEDVSLNQCIISLISRAIEQ